MTCHNPVRQESHRSPLANLRPHPSWCHRAWPAPRCTPSQVQCGCIWLESSDRSASSTHLFTVSCCVFSMFFCSLGCSPSQVPWMLNVLTKSHKGLGPHGLCQRSKALVHLHQRWICACFNQPEYKLNSMNSSSFYHFLSHIRLCYSERLHCLDQNPSSWGLCSSHAGLSSPTLGQRDKDDKDCELLWLVV